MPRSVYTTPVISPVLRALARFGLWVAGWKIEAGPPETVRKCMVIGGPHTSNWDYVLFLVCILVLRMDVKVMVKDNVYRWPIRWLCRWAGVIPVNRRQSNTVVRQMGRLFEDQDDLMIIITPEGTRSKVARWKTGFYHIAKSADVPVLLAYLDYSRKRAGFGPCVYLSDDMDADIADMQAFYAPITPRHPHLR